MEDDTEVHGDTDPRRPSPARAPEREHDEVEPHEPDQDSGHHTGPDAVAAILADGPLTIGGLYRLASAADRALINEALNDLLHTLDRMPNSMDEPWITEARLDAEDDSRTIREVQRTEEQQKRNHNQPPPEEGEEDWDWSAVSIFDR